MNARSMLNEVKFEYLMIMDGISELFFATLSNIEHLFSH